MTKSNQPSIRENTDTGNPQHDPEQTVESLVEQVGELVQRFDEVGQLLRVMQARNQAGLAAPQVLILPLENDESGEYLPGTALLLAPEAYLGASANGEFDQESFSNLLKSAGRALKKVNWGKVAQVAGGALKGAMSGAAGGPLGMFAGAAIGGLGAATQRPDHNPATAGGQSATGFVAQQPTQNMPMMPQFVPGAAGQQQFMPPVAAQQLTNPALTSAGMQQLAAQLAQYLLPLLRGSAHLQQSHESHPAGVNAHEYTADTQIASPIEDDDANIQDDIGDFLSELFQAREVLQEFFPIPSDPEWEIN